MIRRAKVIEVSGNRASITFDGHTRIDGVRIVGDPASLTSGSTVIVAYFDMKHVILTSGESRGTATPAPTHFSEPVEGAPSPHALSSVHHTGTLDGTQLSWGSPTPTTIQAGDTASAGSSTLPSRSDHRHAVSTGAPESISADATASEGTSASLARSDHVHQVGTAAPTTNLAVDSSNAEGSATSFSRSDHAHSISTSSNPGTNETIIATDSGGLVQLRGVGINTASTAQQLRIDGPLHFISTQSITTIAGDLTIAPNSDLVLDPGGTIRVHDDLRTDAWVSGLNGTGWGIQPAGHGDFRSLFAEELRVHAFTAEIYSAMAGAIIITRSRARVSRDFEIPNTGSTGILYVEDLEGWDGVQVFQAGDYVLLRVVDQSGGGLVVTDVYGTVADYIDEGGGEQSWLFTTTTPGYTANDTIFRGSVALDYGTPGDGSWSATVLDLAGAPYSQVQTWASVDDGEPSDFTTHTRMGNLSGLGVSGEYGLYAGQGTGTADKHLLMTDTTARLRNLEFQVYAGGSIVYRIDPDTPSYALGSPAPSAYGTGTGVWAGLDGGNYRWRVGNPAGNRVTWDGSVVNVVGSVAITDGTGVANLDDAGPLATADSADWSTQVTGTGKPADNATVGADWDSNLGSIPARFGDTNTPTTAGLYLAPSYMGFHNGNGATSGWRVYIRNNGYFQFNGNAGNYIRWDGSVLDVNGKIYLSKAEGNLDNIANGSTYGRLRNTSISAGHIRLTSNTVVDGEWYDESGVTIDASSGINIWGTNNALTTRATKTGTIQCYVGSDGILYAGGGAVGLSQKGLRLLTGSTWGWDTGSTIAWGLSLTTTSPYAAISATRDLVSWETRTLRMAVDPVLGSNGYIEILSDELTSHPIIRLNSSGGNVQSMIGGSYRKIVFPYLSYTDELGSNIGITTGWTTILTRTISVPAAARIKVHTSGWWLCNPFTSVTNVQFRILIDGTEVTRINDWAQVNNDRGNLAMYGARNVSSGNRTVTLQGIRGSTNAEFQARSDGTVMFTEVWHR